MKIKGVQSKKIIASIIIALLSFSVISCDTITEALSDYNYDSDYDYDNNTTSDMRPEFISSMNELESFYDEYCDFMKKYQANPTDLGLLNEYVTMTSKFTKWTKLYLHGKMKI